MASSIPGAPLPPMSPSSSGVKVTPTAPSSNQTVQQYGATAQQGLQDMLGMYGSATGLVQTNNGQNIINLPDLVNQLIAGLGTLLNGGAKTLTEIELKLLIYAVFAVLFLMLVWVIVSDKNPVEIIQTGASNTGKAVGSAARDAALASLA